MSGLWPCQEPGTHSWQHHCLKFKAREQGQMKLHEGEPLQHPRDISALCSLALEGGCPALPFDHSLVSFLGHRESWGVCAGASAALADMVSVGTVKLVSWFLFAWTFILWILLWFSGRKRENLLKMNSSLAFLPYIIKIALHRIELSWASFAIGLVFQHISCLEIVSGSQTTMNPYGNPAVCLVTCWVWDLVWLVSLTWFIVHLEVPKE